MMINCRIRGQKQGRTMLNFGDQGAPGSPTGLRPRCLSFPETLAQSVANISPTLTPVVIVPLVFASAGAGTWLAYLFAMIGLVLVGANINQFARRSATPGSLYSYVTRGLGMHAGFVTGWCLILAYLLTAMAVLAGTVNYSDLLLHELHLHAPPLLLYGVGTLGVWLIAYKDIRLSTRVMLVLEVVSMVLILSLGLMVMLKRHSLVDAAQFDFGNMNFAGLKAGLILAIFSFVGYESATTLGEEAKNPHVSIPRSVLLSALISGTFFMLTAYIAVMGFEGLHGSLADSTAPFNDLARGIGVEAFGVLISMGAVISLFACALASVNAASRIIFSMSHGGIFTSHVGRAHATNQTPHLAVSLSCVLILALPGVLLARRMALLDIFNDLSTIATFGFLVVYVLISIAAPLYLKRLGELNGASVMKSLGAIAFMVPPVIATVYPLPAPPADRFPLYFAAYLGTGVLWYGYLLSGAKRP
jgi:amino acid transporter